MSDKLKILFLSAEVAPFAKTGGLGDVAGALPKALRELGHDVRVVMPAYANIESGYRDVAPMVGNLDVPVRSFTLPAGVFHGQLPGSDVPIYFIAEQNLFQRSTLYGYDDDVYRFAFFSRAAFELVLNLDWRPDIVHANDWHTAPAVTWLATAGQADERLRGIPSVFTIHNLMHQGRVSWDIFDYLNIVTHGLVEEDYDAVNFMARGIYHASLVNTVSPTYAREITTPAGGSGMDALLRHRGSDLLGILNGIDVDVWNPADDSRLPAHFDIDSLDKRVTARRALQEVAGLPQRDGVPIVGLVTRLDWQKGLDITGEVVHRLMNNWAGEAQFVMLGTGAPEYEQMFVNLAYYHREKMTAFLEYNAGLAPLIYGGSDMFLVPSRFEPCGLSQMISMRYGSAPVVRATGGLADTVWDGMTGFVFQEYSADAFWQALARAIYVFNVDKPRWREIQQRGMRADFSWRRSAVEYEQAYFRAIGRIR